MSRNWPGCWKAGLLLRLGAQAEVLEPEPPRRRMAETAAELSRLYAEPNVL